MSNILEIENLHCVVLPLNEVLSGKIIRNKQAIDYVQDEAANCNSLACMIKNNKEIMIIFDNEKDSEDFYNLVYFHFTSIHDCVLDGKTLKVVGL